jgi:hypothetical protein
MVGESVGRWLLERKGARQCECTLHIECRAQWRRGKSGGGRGGGGVAGHGGEGGSGRLEKELTSGPWLSVTSREREVLLSQRN